MSLALLVGANPKTCVNTPTVRVPPGNWGVEVDNHVDSDMIIHLSTVDEPQVISKALVITGPCLARVYFVNMGSEPYLTVKLVRI